jgi:hypothetical protein
MLNDSHNLRFSPNTPLPPALLHHKPRRNDQLPPPTLIPLTMAPKHLACKRAIRVCGIPHEAPCCMRVHCQKEDDIQPMSPPEYLISLLSNPRMRRAEHDKHTHQHDVSCHASSLSIKYLHRRLLPQQILLNVEKVNIVASDVHHSPEGHTDGDLPMEVQCFVQGKPAQLGAEKGHQVPAHGQEEEGDVEGERESGTARGPDGEVEGV